MGPLTILGALNDGLGRGIDRLALKAVLDGFAALAFAASFGVGVLLSAVSVLVVQGALTVVGVLLGDLVPDAHISALTATGGLMLAGIALRLLRIRDIPVGDMPPALIVAPLLTQRLVIWPLTKRWGQAFSMPATTASATSRMLIRRSIAAFWIH